MIDDPHGAAEVSPELQKRDIATNAAVPAGSNPEVGPATETDLSKLTPEEQMARFEEQLKEDDWGHQPC